MKKTVFIYNPHSGKGKIEEHFKEILTAFRESDSEVTIVPTKCKNHCKDFIVSDGARFDEICVAGGDGTVNEAFNGIMNMEGEKPVLSYIPMGTTNDFANSCMIPTDVGEAAKTAAEGRVINIDCGMFNGEYFSYVAAFGIFTDVAYDTPQQAKNIFGRAAYIVEGLKRLSAVKSYKIEVRSEKDCVCDEFIFGMVTNSNSVGGVNIAKMEVDLQDGLFEVLLIKNILNPLDINQVIADLLAGRRESKFYYVFKANKLTFTSDENISWTLDGEFGGEHKNALVENIHNGIKIKVARKIKT